MKLSLEFVRDSVNIVHLLNNQERKSKENFALLKNRCTLELTNKTNKIMTTAKILKEYANEDLKTLIENGVLAITSTSFLCPVWFTYENKVFTASKGNGCVLLSTNRKALMRDFIINCFKVV